MTRISEAEGCYKPGINFIILKTNQSSMVSFYSGKGSNLNICRRSIVCNLFNRFNSIKIKVQCLVDG
jgi:hypothetical protein